MGPEASFDYGGSVIREPITVQVLGGFSLRSGSGTIDSLPRRSASLLAYLILNRQRPQTRDLLAGRFWSDLPEDKARKRLSNTLWQIRNALGDVGLDDLIVATNTTIQFDPDQPLHVDAWDFESRLDDLEREWSQRSARGRLADKLTALIDRYPGDLLAGHYDDWIDAERGLIRERYINAVWNAVRLYKSRSDYVTALRYARLLVVHEPLAEENHREVMRLHALLGQPGAAERQYRSCARTLEDELGVEPSWETTELLERIRNEDSRAAAPLDEIGELDTPMIGRSRERATLLSRLDELVNGNGGFMLVEGDAGIGKSRLLEDLADAADWRNIRVLNAACTEVTRLAPFHTVQAVLEPAVSGLRAEHLAEVTEQVWLRQASDVLPGLRQYVRTPALGALRPQEQPDRMTEALARVMLAQGGLGPTVILIEDVHWCDNDSMDVISGLANRAPQHALLICMTYRRFEAEQSEPIWRAISRLEAMPSSTRVVLSPLNQIEMRDLVNARLGPGVLPANVLDVLVGESGGNPLYLLEALQDPDSLLDSEDSRGLDSRLAAFDGFPATVARSLKQRVDSLSPPVRKVLQGMAVLGEPCSSQRVSAITGLDRETTLAALTEAVDRAFLVEIGDGICRYCHDQTRRTVYHSMSEREIVAWHEQILRVLAVVEPPAAEQLAYHADLAGLWEESVTWHTVSAHAAEAVNAFGVAAEHHRQADEAARRAGASPLDRFDELLAYERVLDILGRREEQQGLIKRLLDLDPPLESRVELAERQVWLLGHLSHHDEAARMAARWADRAFDAGLPNHRLLTGLGVVHLWSGSFQDAIEALRLALKAAPGEPDKTVIKNHLGRALIDVAEFDEGEALVVEARQSAEQRGDVRNEVEALLHQWVAAIRLGRTAEVEQLAEEALDLSRTIGYRYGEGLSLGNLAMLRTFQGRTGLALELYEQAAQVFDTLGVSRAKAIVKSNLAEFSAGYLGERDEAAKLYTQAAALSRSVGDDGLELRCVARLSGIDWDSGRRRLARRRLNHLIEQSVAAGDGRGEIEVRRVFAQCLINSGDFSGAAKHLDRALELIDEYAIAWVLPTLLSLRALAAARNGETVVAERCADQAVQSNKPDTEFGFLTAWRCGSVYESLGRRDDAAAQFEFAFSLLESNLEGFDPVMAASARNQPDLAAIVEDYERFHPRFVHRTLSLASAPTGRPLRDDDLVDVTLTASLPEDWSEPEAGTRRRLRILRLCEEASDVGASPRIVDLAEILGVSDRTIKRDLADLREAGHSPQTRRSIDRQGSPNFF